MSEVPMGGYDAPSAELPDGSGPSGRDPKLLIGGGIGLAVVAIVGGYLFLGGGGGGTAAPTAAGVGVHHVTATPTATVIPVGKPTVAVKTFKGDVGRDPFRPLVTAPPPPTPAAAKPTSTGLPAGVTTSPGSVVGPTGLPTGLPPVTAPPVTLPPTVISTTTPPAAKVVVVLKAIAFHSTTPYVLVSYAGVQYALKTGDSAGASLKLLAIAPDDGTATFQLGDQTFDLHIGQSYVD